jgi:hypothetical protein
MRLRGTAQQALRNHLDYQQHIDDNSDTDNDNDQGQRQCQRERTTLRRSMQHPCQSQSEECAPGGTSPQLLPMTTTKTTTQLYSKVDILTDVEVLSIGLSYVGYDAKRQRRVNLDRNMKRFKQFFGPDPTTIVPLFQDLRSAFPSMKYKDALMTLNWLFLNDKQSVLGGRWGCCEEYISPTVRQYAKMIQSLKEKKIKFEFFHNKRYIASIDCCNFRTNEFRLDPSNRWYDHKSNSAGLVSCK